MSMIMRIRELLPAPWGPSRPTIPPRPTEKVAESTATLVPYALVTPRTSSAGILYPTLPEFTDVLDDLADEAVLLGFIGGEPEVAVGVLGDLLHRLAAALFADDLVVPLAQLHDLLGVDLDVAGRAVGHRGGLVEQEAGVGQREAPLLGGGEVDHDGGAGAEPVDDGPDGRL